MYYEVKKKKHTTRCAFSFCICVRRTQHRFAVKPQTSFSRRLTSFRLRTQNDVTPCGVNDVMLRINDVGLRPMMLRFAQKEGRPSPDARGFRIDKGGLFCYTKQDAGRDFIMFRGKKRTRQKIWQNVYA